MKRANPSQLMNRTSASYTAASQQVRPLTLSDKRAAIEDLFRRQSFSVDDLRHQLAISTEQQQKLVRHAEDQDDALNRLRDQGNQWQIKCDDLQNRLDDTSQRLAKQDEAVKVFRNQLRDVTRERDEAQLRVSNLEARLQTLERELADSQARADRKECLLTENVVALQRQLDEAREKQNTLPSFSTVHHSPETIHVDTSNHHAATAALQSPSPRGDGGETEASHTDSFSIADPPNHASPTRRGPPPPPRSRPLSRGSSVHSSPVVPARYTASPSRELSIVRQMESLPQQPLSSSSTAVEGPENPNSQEPLTKYNFATVSKLEYAGNASSPGYFVVVEQRYEIHLIAKPNSGTKAVPLLSSIAAVGSIAVPGHPIKMLGQTWYVFRIFDHLVTRPDDVTAGNYEPLATHLQARMAASQFLRLSNILDLMQDIASSLRVLHSAQLAHGNLSLWTVFVPRLQTAETVLLAAQKCVLSGFGLSPSCRSALHRAPEAPLSEAISLQAADIWALGVLFWEITNYGAVTPYDACPDHASGEADVNVLNDHEKKFEQVRSGALSLTRPEQCPPDLFNIIQPCLEMQPLLRPSIDVVLRSIQQMRATTQ